MENKSIIDSALSLLRHIRLGHVNGKITSFVVRDEYDGISDIAYYAVYAIDSNNDEWCIGIYDEKIDAEISAKFANSMIREINETITGE